jgi:Bacterial self-protective colicin-like immunity
MDEARAVSLYREVIAEFVEGRLSADEFEQRYLATRRQVADAGIYPAGEVGDVLDDLFSDVDAYTSLEPRRPDELDEAALRERATAAASQLEKLLGQA